MIFDTHAHLHFKAYDADRPEVLNRCKEQGVLVVNVGTNLETSKSAVELASKSQSFATIGLHPSHTDQDMHDADESEKVIAKEEFDEVEFAKLLDEKVVGVGECGLDYFHLPKGNEDAAREMQKREFLKQIRFAQKHNLPLVIHCRDAYEDLTQIMKDCRGSAVIHSYTGDWNTAKKFLDLGFHIAFNGILTFDKTGKLAEVVKNMPSDKILTETDAPYLAPPPYRGKRNEPAYVSQVVAKIAELREVSFREAAEQTFNNACNFYKINPPTNHW